MTVKERMNVLKRNSGYIYWVKECKSSLFSKECHVCNKNIKRESFHKVKLYDKHSRQDYKIILCHTHGSEIIG